tara:strand:- start:264 stop:827 length:564 start_codon:yes stop_codon:yes gene_type:complete
MVVFMFFLLYILHFACFQHFKYKKNIRKGFDEVPAKDLRGKLIDEVTINIHKYGIRYWTHPLSKEHKLGSPYGYRKSPISKKTVFHNGQDIPCKKGTWIRAVNDGTVIVSQTSQSAGKYIEIKHNSPTHEVVSRYLHLNRRFVHKNLEVHMGQIIGTCGSTGNSTGNHLHFEIVVNGKNVPPFVDFH